MVHEAFEFPPMSYVLVPAGYRHDSPRVTVAASSADRGCVCPADTDLAAAARTSYGSVLCPAAFACHDVVIGGGGGEYASQEGGEMRAVTFRARVWGVTTNRTELSRKEGIAME